MDESNELEQETTKETPSPDAEKDNKNSKLDNPDFSEFLTLPTGTKAEKPDSNPNCDDLELNGEVFNPEIHITDASGNPVPRANGKGWRKKPGKKPGSSLKPEQGQGDTKERHNQERNPHAAKPNLEINSGLSMEEARQAAETTVDMVTGTCAMFDEDFAPMFFEDKAKGIKFNERETMVLPWQLHYHKKGVSGDNVPTGLLVVCTMAAYFGARMKKKGFFEKLGDWISR